MATVDLSRFATDFRKHYKSVRAQMGAVFFDDDLNDNERLRLEEARRTRADVIGPAGTPDEGFLISDPGITSGKIDFTIGAGSFYLGGIRLDRELDETYQLQSDRLQLTGAALADPPAAGSKRVDLVYLEAFLHAVSSVEDQELAEAGAPGVDGSARIRVRQRVHVFQNVDDTECQPAWSSLVDDFEDRGRGTLNAQNELVPDGKVKVSFLPGDPQDLCSPAVQGGYLGASNQAIRVQIVDATHFLWGFDNAAPLYRVQISNDSPEPPQSPQRRIVTMLTEPKDEEHFPVAGQIVEVLPWVAVLPNNEKLAGVGGFLARVDSSYDPASRTFTLDTGLQPPDFGENWKARSDAADLAAPGEYYYLRVWNRGGDFTSPPAIEFEPDGSPVPLGNTGVQVQFTGSEFRPGDFWIIAVRPETPNEVVPWIFKSGREPHGYRRFFAPLALVEWDATVTPVKGTVIHDCRPKFPPLTRQRACCTYTVGDGVVTFGNFSKIQDAISALPSSGGEICLLPGTYVENVEIAGRRGIRIHGCGRRSVLRAATAGQPVVSIQDSQRIQLDGVRIEAPAEVGVRLASTPVGERKGQGLLEIDLRHLECVARDAAAVECHGGRFIRVKDNDVVLSPLAAPLSNASPAGKSPALFVRADDVEIEGNRIAAEVTPRLVMALGGIQIGGGSERVRIQRNRILSGNGNGITLGSASLLPQDVILLLKRDFHAAMAASFGLFFGGIIVDENGCIHVDPDPTPPGDPDNPQVPVSDGNLEDIRIIDNDILDMGLCGIATFRLVARGFGLISVEDVQIEGNRIRRCMQIELGARAITAITPLGFGGVALAAAAGMVLRGNWIERNGRSSRDPICGVFVLRGLDLEIVQNSILENGLPSPEPGQAAPGPRAGIWIGFVSGGTNDQPKPIPGRSRGLPALLVEGNIVVSTLGPALYALARGLVRIEGNSLTALGVAPRSRILDIASPPSRAELTKAGGLLALPDLLGGLGGEAVAVANIGRTIEPDETLLLGFRAAGKNIISGSRLVAAAVRPVFAGDGGNLMFHDNQVTLAGARSGERVIISSVLLVSYDDVSMDGNQCDADVGTLSLHSNGLVVGTTVRVTANRFKERARFPGFSAMTIAPMNCTTANQGTRCFLAVGRPRLLVAHSNRSWIDDILNDPICRRIAASFAGLYQGSGLTVSAGNERTGLPA